MPNAGRPRPRLRAFVVAALANGVLIALGFSVSIGALELAFRIAGNGSDQLLRQDPVLGVSLIPGKSGLNQGDCFRANPTINSHGWRSAETSWEKPQGVYRVLVLGDSFMAGLQVEDDETFAALLEGLLNEAGAGEGPSGRVEAINLGVPSFGNAQEYLAFREFGRSYDPDLVVLAFYAQNDVSNNSRVLERRHTTYPKPFFEVDGGALVELPFQDRTPGWIALLRRLVQPLRIYPWTRDRLNRIPAVQRLLFAAGLTGTVPQKDDPELAQTPLPRHWASQTGVYQRDYDADWEHAWDITRALLLRLRAESAALGAHFLLLNLAEPLSVLPQDMLARELPPHGAAAFDFDKPDRLLRRFADKNAIDYLTLIPAFREAIGDSEAAFEALYLICNGHWTPRGHRLAAEAVAAHLAPIVRSDPRP